MRLVHNVLRLTLQMVKNTDTESVRFLTTLCLIQCAFSHFLSAYTKAAQNVLLYFFFGLYLIVVGPVAQSV